ncbi:unnamed protein product [Ceutorhynchus assimilis]|uniref:Ciliogenesis-associated TTC17-interacting protein N-terminal domain-containing protein n=1 Tax=Ceutorhynchus assimilis TaxID=467358 RepID=A0A9N9QRV8_9CUCU|nr:unnamed protein product [Ceutorhynchus assimilis]
MNLSLLTNKPKTIEKYVEDTIIEYLQSQTEAVEESSSYDFEKINAIELAAVEESQEKQKNLFIVEEILNDLINEVDRTVLCRHEYLRSLKAHHQYALFDLKDVIPDCTELEKPNGRDISEVLCTPFNKAQQLQRPGSDIRNVAGEAQRVIKNDTEITLLGHCFKWFIVYLALSSMPLVTHHPKNRYLCSEELHRFQESLRFYPDETLIRRLCFRETLLISNIDELDEENATPKAVGGLCLKVELVRGAQPESNVTEKQINENIKEKIKELKKQLAVKTTGSSTFLKPPETEEIELQRYKEFLEDRIRQAPHKFVVHLSSEFDVDGENAGSRIISWVDKDFHTMEERRTEYFYHQPKEEKRLYFALMKDKYYIKYRDCSEAISDDKRNYYSLSKTKDLIGEGANFILMRYLAITRYRGVFELSTIYINGEMCRNIYECKGPKPGFVNGHPVDVCKIYRTIMEECGIIHLSVTVLTVYGMIISQEWEGCPYIVHINPEFVTYGKPIPYDYIALKKVWETNMELVSKYLDCKVEAEFKMQTFIRDHPEIQDMLADYLQSALLLKPENIMQFTKDYFLNLEPYKLPESPYFDEFIDTLDLEDGDMFW